MDFYRWRWGDRRHQRPDGFAQLFLRSRFQTDEDRNVPCKRVRQLAQASTGARPAGREVIDQPASA
jgi:hypothetical protein